MNFRSELKAILNQLADQLLDLDMVENPDFYWHVRFGLWLKKKVDKP